MMLLAPPPPPHATANTTAVSSAATAQMSMRRDLALRRSRQMEATEQDTRIGALWVRAAFQGNQYTGPQLRTGAPLLRMTLAA
jgi:hypothetical protein